MLLNGKINRKMFGNMKNTGLITCALLSICIMLTGCVKRGDALPEAEGKVVVVATIFPLADWARQVGGERVYVETLLPAGASPHTFDAAPRDMRLIAQSQLFLKTGLKMDDWGASLVRSSGKDGPRVISVGDLLLDEAKLPNVEHLDIAVENVGVEESHEHDGHNSHAGHSHGNVNPHFWLDPELAIASVTIIRDALIEADPEGKTIYEANAGEYLQKLDRLDADLGLTLKPYSGRAFVSFHNAWPYLARRYHLKIAAVIEEYAGKTPSEKYLRTVTDRLKTLQIRTVFTEPQLNPHVAEMIAEAVGGSVSTLDPYGTEGNANRGSYLKMMKYNAEQLASALAKETTGSLMVSTANR